MARRNIKTDYDSPLAKNLRTLVDREGENQTKLSKALGITPQAVSTYVNGTAVPDIILIGEIADYYNVSLDWLLGRERDAVSEEQRLAQTSQYLGLSVKATSVLKDLGHGRQVGKAFQAILSKFIEDQDHFGAMITKIVFASRIHLKQPKSGVYVKRPTHIQPDGMVLLEGEDAQQFFIDAAAEDVKAFAREYIRKNRKED